MLESNKIGQVAGIIAEKSENPQDFLQNLVDIELNLMDTGIHEDVDPKGYELEKDGYKRFIEGKQISLTEELETMLVSPELSPSPK